MAADEVLLKDAAAGLASLRFYVWSEATLSLGYFQSAAPARSDGRLADLPMVRRASGGEALVHHQEVTYAIALPPGLPWQTRGDSWVRRMHLVIGQVLGDFGIQTALCTREEKRGAILCFLHHTPDDLLIQSTKIAGSAQRKQQGALLQHGGILLAQSPHTPALPGIAELAGKTLPASELALAIQQHLATSQGWVLEPTGWSDEQRQRIQERIRDRYADAGWNLKR